jgi:O-antigen ligase
MDHRRSDAPVGLAVDGTAIVVLIALLLTAAVSPLAAAALALATAALSLTDPTWALVLIAISSSISPDVVPPLANLGGFSVRWQDAALAALLGALVIRHRLSSPTQAWMPRAARHVFLALGIFVSYIGITLLSVYINAPERAAGSIASHARIAEYALLAPLTFLALRPAGSVERFTARLAFVGIAVVLLAAADLRTGQMLTSERMRVNGSIGTQTLGLVSAMLCLGGVVGALRGSLRGWPVLALLAAGGLGLLLSKSAISGLSFGLSAALLFVLHVRRRDMLTPLILTGALTLAVAVGLAGMRLLRPSDFEGLVQLSGGSFVHRLVMASAGLLLLARSPLFGLGWQMSLSTDALKDPALNATLLQWFPAIPGNYFPSETPTSLHNLYLEIAVELGLIGLSAFVVLAIAIARAAALAIAKRQDACAVYYAYALLTLMIWWNSSALWGGQAETFLVFVATGAVCAMGTATERPPTVAHAPAA